MEGRLHTRNWEGQDGQPHTRMEVVANRVLFLDRKGGGFGDERSDERSDDAGMADLEPEDLPF